MAKITFNVNDSFKSMLDESYNMFITDYLMDVGERCVGKDTNTLIELNKAALVTLKRLYKKLTTCTVRCTIDTNSDEFKMFDTYICYVVDKIAEDFFTFNRETLVILRNALISSILHSTRNRRGYIDKVDELIRESEEKTI